MGKLRESLIVVVHYLEKLVIFTINNFCNREHRFRNDQEIRHIFVKPCIFVLSWELADTASTWCVAGLSGPERFSVDSKISKGAGSLCSSMEITITELLVESPCWPKIAVSLQWVEPFPRDSLSSSDTWPCIVCPQLYRRGLPSWENTKVRGNKGWHKFLFIFAGFQLALQLPFLLPSSWLLVLWTSSASTRSFKS